MREIKYSRSSVMVESTDHTVWKYCASRWLTVDPTRFVLSHLKCRLYLDSIESELDSTFGMTKGALAMEGFPTYDG